MTAPASFASEVVGNVDTTDFVPVGSRVVYAPDEVRTMPTLPLENAEFCAAESVPGLSAAPSWYSSCRVLMKATWVSEVSETPVTALPFRPFDGVQNGCPPEALSSSSIHESAMFMLMPYRPVVRWIWSAHRATSLRVVGGFVTSSPARWTIALSRYSTGIDTENGIAARPSPAL